MKRTLERSGAAARYGAADGRRSATDLGEQMRARRIELGLSSSQLSELTGMTTLFIEQLEGGRISVTVPLLCRLAEALRMRVQIAFVPE